MGQEEVEVEGRMFGGGGGGDRSLNEESGR